MKRLLTLAALATLATARLAAQSSTRTSVSVLSELTLFPVQAMDFGGHFPSERSVFSGRGNIAQWRGVSIPAQSHISLTFSLPNALLRNDGASVPFSCGTTSGIVLSGVNISQFNPNAGDPDFGPTTDQFDVFLGREFAESRTPPESDLCTVDITGAGPGFYQATLTLTVAVL